MTGVSAEARGWSRRRRIVLAAIAAGCVLAAAGTAGVVLARDSSDAAAASASSPLLAGGTAALDERTFLDLMIPHHEMAIEMARIAMRRSDDLAVHDVARDVLAEQPWEVRLMTRWRKAWFGEPEGERAQMSSADAAMMGMAADMGALRRAKPLAPRFYQDMIPHHAGAVLMAQRLLLDHPRPQLARLARVILRTQSAQIGTMERYRQIATGGGGGPAGAPARAAPAKPVTPGA
jgi:uncharacterized protein (DUF305 family)